MSISEIPFVVRVDEPKGRLERTSPDGGAMLYPLLYQVYKYERGLTAAEQQAADVRAGEAAAALRDLRLRLGRTFRPRHRVRSARRAADAVTASVRSRRVFGRGGAMRYMLIHTADPGPGLGVGRRDRGLAFVLDRGDDQLRGRSAGEPPAADSGCHHDQDPGRRAHHYRQAVRGDQGAGRRLRRGRVRQPGRGSAVGQSAPPLPRGSVEVRALPGRAPARAGRRQDPVHDARLHRPGDRPPRSSPASNRSIPG